MLTFVFPGQGAQAKGMGEKLFDEFRELTAQADDILGYSIKRLCMEGPETTLSQTQYTQPALYVVNALSYLKIIRKMEKKPDFLAGHSLGEYNALFAGGAFDFAEGLKLVKKRGELMGSAVGGGMAAIIGLDEEQVSEVLRQNNLHTIDVANYNSPYQMVISGLKEDVEKAKPIFEANKNVKMVTSLTVSGAFHSRYMSEARKEFEKTLDTVNFQPLSIPVISNVYARPYSQARIKTTLAEQINSSVKWSESIRYLMGKGDMEFEQIGPGKVLTGMIKRIKKEAEPLIVSNEEAEQLPEEIQHQAPQRFSVEQNPIGIDIGIQENPDVQKQVQYAATEASLLGSSEFKKDYNLKYAYLAGGMAHGISSKEMVVRMGKAGMMGFFGTGGLKLGEIESAIIGIQKELSGGQAYGLNFLHNPNNPGMEEETVDLFLKYKVKNIEAAAFLLITPSLVKYRAKGLRRDGQGKIAISNRIMAKVSRPEVAEAFLSPAPERIITKLLDENKITSEEADFLKAIPMADDICAEADSAGHTDGGVAYALTPSIMKLRDEMMEKYRYQNKVRVGAAGGIGTPAAAAAAFILGADFILTGSVNQCTVEAATSDSVKDLLQQVNVQDTQYAPAGDMFEIGARVQVLKKGVFFPVRANKLYNLYCQFNSLDQIDEKTRIQIQERYFKRSFEKVYEDVKAYYTENGIKKAEKDPKYKMALIFKWYFGYSTRLALNGSEENRVDYQVHCGPALGAFNQWVKGTELESWRARHADEIGNKLMAETEDLIKKRLKTILRQL